ncbi:alpha/beta fold hydrolase [Kitasatospora sp. NPDC002040]|uniref:thioesterase II family protein n=1 Tax=Kitasatospora sp. NPDC002040 TaxID=3154661 RepID=UPI0033238164
MDETVLICLPFAGTGASFFRSWQALVPAGMRILPVQLPGREERYAMPPLTEVARATDDAHAQVASVLGGGARIALFGHSLGAVLAYELAHRLRAEGRTEIVGLFASGSPDPWSGRRDRATGLPDAEFVAQVQRFAGYAHPALADPELRELLLPLLRSDVEMHENYRPASDSPLDIPVTAVRGRDDELVCAAESARWSRATTASFESVDMDGGHMYLTDGVPALLGLIGTHLDLVQGR